MLVCVSTRFRRLSNALCLFKSFRYLNDIFTVYEFIDEGGVLEFELRIRKYAFSF